MTTTRSPAPIRLPADMPLQVWADILDQMDPEVRAQCDRIYERTVEAPSQAFLDLYLVLDEDFIELLLDNFAPYLL